jgi:hypothetical protein
MEAGGGCGAWALGGVGRVGAPPIRGWGFPYGNVSGQSGWPPTSLDRSSMSTYLRGIPTQHVIAWLNLGEQVSMQPEKRAGACMFPCTQVFLHVPKDQHHDESLGYRKEKGQDTRRKDQRNHARHSTRAAATQDWAAQAHTPEPPTR